MGMTVGGTMIYGNSLVSSLPAVMIALSQAVIDKTYLTWLDVSKLLTAFPEYVKMVGDTVIFQGPVAIISSMDPQDAFLHGACSVLHLVLFVTLLVAFLRGKKKSSA